MNDAGQKACVFGGLIIVAYGIYAFTNQDQPDGYVFGSVLAVIAAIGGYVVGAIRGKEKA